jgi:membrane protein required for colicin V production
MELYDLIFLGILLFSCLSGLLMGGTKAIIGTASFILAVLIAIWTLPWLTKTFSLGEINSIVAAFLVFVLTYFGVRILGNALSKKLNEQKVLGYLDRLLGLAFGALRALVFLGFIHLLFALVLPKDKPQWFVGAKVYPLGVECAKVIRSLAPSWGRFADSVTKAEVKTAEPKIQVP